MKQSIWSKISHDKKWLTYSNGLTMIRVLLAPVVFYGIINQWWYGTFCIFFLASLTDVLDGYVARLCNESTEFGKLLDPIADKIFLVTCFSALAFFSSPSFHVPIWFVILLVIRETVILVGSIFLLTADDSFTIHPTIWGKLTTFFQLLFIAWLFVCYFFSWAPHRTFFLLLSSLSILSMLSLMQYIKIGIAFLFGKRRL